MNRLKREWEETQIPEEVQLRTRNLAWAKIQRRTRGRRLSGWAAAASTALAMVALVWIWRGGETRVEKVSVLPPQDIARTIITTKQTGKPLVETPQVLENKPVNKNVTLKQANALAKQPVRIVLNFKLPDSGARMIWTMDSSFQLGGDDK